MVTLSEASLSGEGRHEAINNPWRWHGRGLLQQNHGLLDLGQLIIWPLNINVVMVMVSMNSQ